MFINNIADALYKSNLSYGKILSAFIRGWMLVLAIVLLFCLVTMAYIHFYDNRYIAVAHINEVYDEKLDINTFLIELKDYNNFSDEVRIICGKKRKFSKFNTIVNTIAILKISNKKYKLSLNLNSANSDGIEECSQAIFFSIKDFFVKYYKNQISENLININSNNVLAKELVDNLNLSTDLKNFVNLSFLNEISQSNLKIYKNNLYLDRAINLISIGNIDITFDRSNYIKYFALSIIFGLFLSLFIVAYKEILITLNLFFSNLK